MTAPIQVFSLAEHLADEMEHREWTTTDIAERMDGDFTRNKLTLDVVLAVTPKNDNCLISDSTFAGISKTFDISETFFRRLHQGWLDYPEARSQFDAPDRLFGLLTRFKDTKSDEQRNG